MMDDTFISCSLKHHVCPTFSLGAVIDKQVLGSSSEIDTLGHQSLLYGLHPIHDYYWFGTEK